MPEAVDLYPLYPLSLRPLFLNNLRSWYIATYKDRFFTEQQPAWFWMFTVMEAGWHVPISLTSIKPLWMGDGTSIPFRLSAWSVSISPIRFYAFLQNHCQ